MKRFPEPDSVRGSSRPRRNGLSAHRRDSLSQFGRLRSRPGNPVTFASEKIPLSRESSAFRDFPEREHRSSRSRLPRKFSRRRTTSATHSAGSAPPQGERTSDTVCSRLAAGDFPGRSPVVISPATLRQTGPQLTPLRQVEDLPHGESRKPVALQPPGMRGPVRSTAEKSAAHPG